MLGITCVVSWYPSLSFFFFLLSSSRQERREKERRRLISLHLDVSFLFRLLLLLLLLPVLLLRLHLFRLFFQSARMPELSPSSCLLHSPVFFFSTSGELTKDLFFPFSLPSMETFYFISAEHHGIMGAGFELLGSVGLA